MPSRPFKVTQVLALAALGGVLLATTACQKKDAPVDLSAASDAAAGAAASDPNAAATTPTTADLAAAAPNLDIGTASGLAPMRSEADVTAATAAAAPLPVAPPPSSPAPPAAN